MASNDSTRRRAERLHRRFLAATAAVAAAVAVAAIWFVADHASENEPVATGSPTANAYG